MATAGIDVGTWAVKAVVVDSGQVTGKAIVRVGFDLFTTIDEVLTRALEQAGLQREALSRLVATGAGRGLVATAQDQVTEVTADARGASFLCPGVRTVLDVGAEESRALRCDGVSGVLDFAINERCAAGAGAFIETMARALGAEVSEMGALSLASTRAVSISAQCTIFAESEVISLIHAQTPREDIARAVHEAIAGRILTLVRRVGVEEPVALFGGVAHNAGFVDALERALHATVLVPRWPEYAGALGAALIAAEKFR